MLEEHGRLRALQDGEKVFAQGEPGNEMYIVRSGMVEIYRVRDGREIPLTNLGEGEFFGEMALFDESPRSASARAKGDTELQVIDKDTFSSFITEPIVWTILENMGKRIRQVDDKIEELSVQDQVRKEHLSSLSTQRRWFL